jgi:hypothetical protein
MKLTRSQVAYLKNCRRGRGTSPSIPNLLWQARRAWVPSVPFAAVGIWLVFSAWDVLGWLMIVFAWGMMFASFVVASRVHSTLPVFQEIVNWDRVDALIGENEQPGF